MFDRPKARIEGLVTEWFDDELVVYDQLNQTAHSLSAAAASVWEQCDGWKSVYDISERLLLEPAMVEQAQEELIGCGLLEEITVYVPGYSRREATVKLAKVAGAVFAAPLIYSVAVPSAASAASCIANGNPVTGKKCNNGVDAQCCSGACNESGSSGNGTCCGVAGATCSPNGSNTQCCSGTCTSGVCT